MLWTWIASSWINYLELSSYSINFFCVLLFALNFSDVTFSIFSNVLKNMGEVKPLPEEWLQITKPFKGDICKNLTFLCYLRFVPSWEVRRSELCNSYFCILLDDISHLAFTLLHLRQHNRVDNDFLCWQNPVYVATFLSVDVHIFQGFVLSCTENTCATGSADVFSTI